MSLYPQAASQAFGQMPYPTQSYSQPMIPPPTYHYPPTAQPVFHVDPNMFRRDYMARLAELTINSRPIIQNLSMLAQEFSRFAEIVVQSIETHIRRVSVGSLVNNLCVRNAIVCPCVVLWLGSGTVIVVI